MRIQIKKDDSSIIDMEVADLDAARVYAARGLAVMVVDEDGGLTTLPPEAPPEDEPAAAKHAKHAKKKP